MPTVQTTILFSDLVGSTELSQRLGPAAAESLRQKYFSLLRKAVAAHEGTEVKNLGDGLMVTFPLPSAALGCAVSMQQGIDGHNRSAVDQLRIRVGISTGEVTVEDGDCFGDPVVEAARLCAVADAGQILAAEVVRSVAGRRAAQTFVTVGPLHLKGFDAPVPTVEVTWAPLTSSEEGRPLPPRLAAGPATGFFGRAGELARLTEAFKAAAAGEGRRVILVQGEPGMGKTTLASQLARGVHGQGAVVLYGGCEEGLGVPYQPFAESLGEYVSHADDEQLAAHIGEHGSALAGLVPALARRVPGLPPPRSADADTQRYLFFAAVVGLVAALSADQAVLLVVDDLHWADPASLMLFRHLVSAEAPRRLLVLGTFRGSEVGTTPALGETLAALRRESGVERLDLVGLEDSEVFALLESGAGHELGDPLAALAGRLRSDTGGNPFFLLEVVRHLVEGGWLYQDGERWRARASLADLGMPASLHEVIGARVARLGVRVEQLLTDAAVIGRDFDLELVGAVSGAGDDEVVDALERARSGALLTSVTAGRYSFAHAVIQYTLYDSLGPTRRQLAHRRVAEALERLYGEGPGPRVAEVARHWLAGARPTEPERPLRYARWAGEAALADLAFENAARWFAEALGLQGAQPTPDGHLRAELLIGLGRAQRLSGDAAFRETLLVAAHLAEALGDTDRLVRAALANNRGAMSATASVDTERVAVLRSALAATTGDSADRALLLATLAVELTHAGDWPDRRDLATQAISMARRLGEPRTLVRVLSLTYNAVSVPETLGERLATTSEAVSLAEGQPDPALRCSAHDWRYRACGEAGDFDGAIHHAEVMATAALASGDPFHLWSAGFNRAWRALLAGDLVNAETLAAEALQIGAGAAQQEAIAIYAVQLFEIRRAQDRVPEIEQLFVQACLAYPGVAVAQILVANLYSHIGKYEQARALFRQVAADDFAAFGYDYIWLLSMTSCAEVCARLGETDTAQRLHERLAPWHDQFTIVNLSVAGSVAHYLGMLATTLGRYEQAEAHFGEALQVHARMRTPYGVATTHLELARMLLARGDRDDLERAATLLGEVDGIAAQFGFDGLHRHTTAIRQTNTL